MNVNFNLRLENSDSKTSNKTLRGNKNPSEIIRWKSTDLKIIFSAFYIWNKVKYEFSENDKKEIILINHIIQPMNRKKNVREIDRFVSAVFFNHQIPPSKLSDCWDKKRKEIIFEKKEAWKTVVELFSSGHTFGEKKISNNSITIDVSANTELAKVYIKYGATHGDSYCIDRNNQIQTEISNPTSNISSLEGNKNDRFVAPTQNQSISISDNITNSDNDIKIIEEEKKIPRTSISISSLLNPKRKVEEDIVTLKKSKVSPDFD